MPPLARGATFAIHDRSSAAAILPDGTKTARRHAVLRPELPQVGAVPKLDAARLTFKNSVSLLRRWLEPNPK